MKKIKKLENDTISKQLTLEQVTPYFLNYMTVKLGILKNKQTPPETTNQKNPKTEQNKNNNKTCFVLDLT